MPPRWTTSWSKESRWPGCGCAKARPGGSGRTTCRRSTVRSASRSSAAGTRRCSPTPFPLSRLCSKGRRAPSGATKETVAAAAAIEGGAAVVRAAGAEAGPTGPGPPDDGAERSAARGAAGPRGTGHGAGPLRQPGNRRPVRPPPLSRRRARHGPGGRRRRRAARGQRAGRGPVGAGPRRPPQARRPRLAGCGGQPDLLPLRAAAHDRDQCHHSGEHGSGVHRAGLGPRPARAGLHRQVRRDRAGRARDRLPHRPRPGLPGPRRGAGRTSSTPGRCSSGTARWR
jgi:hypothetical protein